MFYEKRKTQTACTLTGFATWLYPLTCVVLVKVFKKSVSNTHSLKALFLNNVYLA